MHCKLDYYLLGVLLYELLVGIPPYFSNNRNHLFQNIIKGPLLLPKWLSDDCKHLMKRVLTKLKTSFILLLLFN